MTVLLGVFLLAAALGKALNPAPAVAVLQKVWGIPPGLSSGVLVVMIAAEAAIAAWFVSGVAIRACLVTTAAVLLIMTLSPVRQVLSGSSLPCGCGIPMTRRHPEVDQILAITRNGPMVLGCVAIAALPAHPRKEERTCNAT
jgi:hypothetical protein